MTSGFRNILLVQLGDIGDVVLTTPTIRAVKENNPSGRLSVLVRKPFGQLLACDPSVDEVIESEKYRGSLLSVLQKYAAFAKRLRNARYDLVIDLRTGDRGAILSFLTRAPMRVGCQGNQNQFWRQVFFTRLIRDLKVAPPPVHPGADQSLRVIRELGMDTADSIPRLYVSSADQQAAKELLATTGILPANSMVTINPYSRWKYKEWSNEKWGRLIDLIWEAHGMPAVLIGSPEEAAGCEAIVASRGEHAFNLAGKTTLGELAAVLSMSSLHLGIDSAAPHIAAALGRPTVTIHGPTDWRAWRIADEQHRIVTAEMDCLPCNMMGCEGTGKSRCLDELGVEPVIRAALEVLQQHEMLSKPVPEQR